LSVADTGLTYENELGQSYSQYSPEVGFMVGGGLEYSVMEHLSVRAEYLYTKLRQRSIAQYSSRVLPYGSERTRECRFELQFTVARSELSVLDQVKDAHNAHRTKQH
jgi:opacity protein-like surface antigen